MNRIVTTIPNPKGDHTKPLQALIFDAYYDQYQGVIGLVFVKNGYMATKMRIKSLLRGKEYQITQLQIKKPHLVTVTKLEAGEVGLFQANIKKLEDVVVGDTLVAFNDCNTKQLTTNQNITHNVFAHFFPLNPNQYIDLHRCLQKIQLTDVALSFHKINSTAFGNGFYCGFLGLLHLDIIHSRLEKEYNLEVITTIPSVSYQMEGKQKTKMFIDNIAKITN